MKNVENIQIYIIKHNNMVGLMDVIEDHKLKPPYITGWVILYII